MWLPSRLRAMAGGAQRDRGAATIWGLAVALCLVAAGLAGMAVGDAHLASRQVQAAADFAALAGAARLAQGDAAACRIAAEVAAANGSRLVSCTADGLELVVYAQLDVEPFAGMRGTASAGARAGPAAAPVAAGSGPDLPEPGPASPPGPSLPPPHPPG